MNNDVHATATNLVLRIDPPDVPLMATGAPRQVSWRHVDDGDVASGCREAYVLRGSRSLHALAGGALGAVAMAAPLGVVNGPALPATSAVVGIALPMAAGGVVGAVAAASPAPSPCWQGMHVQPAVQALIALLAGWAAVTAESCYLEAKSYRVEDAAGSTHRVYPSNAALVAVWAGVFVGVVVLETAALCGMARLTRRAPAVRAAAAAVCPAT